MNLRTVDGLRRGIEGLLEASSLGVIVDCGSLASFELVMYVHLRGVLAKESCRAVCLDRNPVFEVILQVVFVHLSLWLSYLLGLPSKT